MRLATDELIMEAGRRGTTLALLQEPYVGGEGVVKGYPGTRVYQRTGGGTVKAAIMVFDSRVKVTEYPELTSSNVVVIGAQSGTWKIVLVSFYFEPDQPIAPYLEHLKKIREVLGNRKLIIGGDANAKNTWWGDHR